MSVKPPAYLDEFAYRAAAVLGDHIQTSIILQHHGATVRAASSSAGAARCDQAEAVANEGPCIVAMNELRAQVLPDLAAECRWQDWCEEAIGYGFSSMLAMPAAVTAEVTLALNLYSTRTDPWDARLLAAADSYAQLAAGMVALRLELAALEDATAGVYALLDDEHVVEQAVVAIMRSQNSTEQQARSILESASAHRNVTPRAVAETILKALTGEDPHSA